MAEAMSFDAIRTPRAPMCSQPATASAKPARRHARAYVDARVSRIYGGTSEVMKELISRGL